MAKRTATKSSKYALGLLDELGEQLERDYAVASVLVDRLGPGKKDESADPVAHRLAQALEERIEDVSLFNMLREYLVSVNAGVSHA